MATHAIEGASRPDVDIDALPCKYNITLKYKTQNLANLFFLKKKIDVDRELHEDSKQQTLHEKKKKRKELLI